MSLGRRGGESESRREEKVGDWKTNLSLEKKLGFGTFDEGAEDFPVPSLDRGRSSRSEGDHSDESVKLSDILSVLFQRRR